jgi:uncharacterized membrane protein YdjX (TVP38/TMEM64 family)
MNKKPIRKKFLKSPLFYTLLATFFLALMVLIFYFYHEGMWRDVISFFETKRLETFIASYGTYAGLVFVVIQALQVIIAPIPGEVTGFVGGFLFGNAIGTILSTIGLTLGSMGAFFIARFFGLRLVEKIVKQKYRDKFDYLVTHKGLYITFVLYLIPGFPKDSLSYLLGLTKLKLLPFIFMNVFGRLPGTLLLTTQGSAVDNKEYETFFLLLAGSFLITLILCFTRDHCTKATVSLVRWVLKRKNNQSIGDTGKDV